MRHILLVSLCVISIYSIVGIDNKLYDHAELPAGTVIKGINNYDETGRTPLINAVGIGYLAAVLQLIKGGADVNIPVQFTTDTPLYIAAELSFEHVVVALLNNNAHVDTISSLGVTPLYMAAQTGSLPIVKSLIKSGASTASTLSEGVTPLMIAALKGNLDIIKFLVEYNKTLLHDVTISGDTVLMHAVISGHYASVKYIVESNVNIDALNNRNFTAVAMAAKSNQLKILQYLIESGADINKRDFIGRTALEMAKVITVYQLLLATC